MSIDIAACVGELLYEHESVIIPQLGGFMASYRAASIDHVQGVLQPPSKGLNFNDNLVVNDGRLVEYVAKKYSLDRSSAEEEIHKFVEQTKLSLHQREIVNFPGVGRLYLDFEKKHKFLQDQNNFNTESFGLPSVQFYPIYRNQETRTNPVPAAAPSVTPRSSASITTSTKKPNRLTAMLAGGKMADWMQPFMLGVVFLALGVIILSVVIIKRELKPNQATVLMGETKPVNLNQPPGGMYDDEDPTLVRDYEEEQQSTDLEEVEIRPGNDSGIEDTEGATLAPDVEQTIVIIGLFKNRKNIEKLNEKIFLAGFEAYTAPKDGATQVGVIFASRNDQERDKKLERVRSEFNSKAYILQQ
ncbi:MAG: hypothetical protein AAFU60_03895 [Bacteroidota bacterium]